MKNSKSFWALTLVSITLVAAVSFAGFNYLDISNLEKTSGSILGTTTDYQDINVTTTIANVEEGSNKLTVDYVYTFKNNNPISIRSLIAENNLASNFSPYNFQLLDISSDYFTLNNNFNGSNDINLLASNQVLGGASTAKIYITVEITNNGDLGPFRNEVSAQGIFDVAQDDAEPEENDNDGGSNNNGGDDGEDDEPDLDSYPAETNLSPRYFRVYLINRDNNTVVTEIVNGSIINIDEIFDFVEVGLDIRVDVNPPTVGGIRFKIQQGPENVLFREDMDFPDEYRQEWMDWLFEYRGAYQMIITAYTEKDAEGSIINQQTINFTVPELVQPEVVTSGSASVEFTLELEKPSNPPTNPPTQGQTGVIPTNEGEQDNDTQNTGSNPAPSPTPNPSSNNGGSVAGATTGGTTSNGTNYSVVSSGSSQSLPTTGFGLNNTYIYGIVAVLLVNILNISYLKNVKWRKGL